MLNEISDLIGQVFVGGTLTAFARIVDWSNNLLLQETTSTITYTITDPNGDPVSGHTAVSLVKTAVVFDALQLNSQWTADTTGFNFAHTVDVADLGPAFAITGTYSLEYTITPTSGQAVLVRYAITAF